MRRRHVVRRILILLGFGALLSLLTGTAFWASEMHHEVKVRERARDLVQGKMVREADAVLKEFEQRPFTKFRIASGTIHPSVLLLHGVALAHMGNYGDAVEFFQRAVAACETRLIKMEFTPDVCRLLQADANVRAGDAAFTQWADRAFSVAIRFYGEGLEFKPDDRDTKKILEWLLVQEEEYRERSKGGQKTIRRGPGLFDPLPKKSDEGGASGKGHKGY